ncbi:MAG TPA: ABC transporter permease [Streptosporangiaceae bacterium]|jgi:ABC-2 type transport system permease protein|nr:ABC transporter permease [Streptosporangiaceae bacterium]
MNAMTAAPASREQAEPHRLPSSGAVLLTQIRYQLRLLVRTPRAMVAGLLLPSLLLVVSDTGHGTIAPGRLAGLAILGVTITAWSTNGISLVTAREAGVLKRWRATPMPPWCYFVGRVVATVVIGTLAGAVTMVLGVLLYHTHMSAPIALGVLVSLALGALAWSAAAMAVTGFIPNVASAWPILMLIYLPVVLISGVFGGITDEPHWLTSLASYLPAQPVINAATRALQYSAGRSLFSVRDIVVLACWTVGGLVASRFLFRWQPTRRATARPARSAGAAR